MVWKDIQWKIIMNDLTADAENNIKKTGANPPLIRYMYKYIGYTNTKL